MKRWLFAGVSDKRELILYICKLLTASGQRVLLVDRTAESKYQYLTRNREAALPLIEFCGFDITSGKLITTEEGTGLPEATRIRDESYDYVLYDYELDQPEERGLCSQMDQFIWVTTYDHYEVERSADWFRQLLRSDPELAGVRVHPVLIRTVESYLTADYMISLADDLPIEWNTEVACIPWNELNAAIHYENGHEHMLHIHRITSSYRRALISLIIQLTGWTRNETKRAMRSAKRRVI
ncbi:hypothetical protein RE628_11875 [Paenibacillus sp. D2_2]|uniref:hypothetical protein n=1 Tax=Paenibacillus sp. D2_2 TaxID=3073092 RepID=UPI00281506FE|nr:hypothetical protein [Paenibacillus sp. D2_2]WMT42915.1 hypothetical protein RE628_11875 [Paenibacillus sp. D2_2]